MTSLESSQLITNALMADSMIELDESQCVQLVAAIEADGLPYPTAKQAEILVMGDEDGQVPEAASALYPRTNRFIDGLF